MNRLARAWPILVTLVATCCGRQQSAPTRSGAASARPSASAPPSARSAAAALPAASVGATPYVAAKACRALSVKGRVTRPDGTTLATGDVLDHPVWLQIAPSAELVVEHVVTSREVTFAGPARVLPCDRGEERFLLTEGHVSTTTSAGARPGAEVLLGTPLGAVWYGDARLDVSVTARRLAVHAESGDAWLAAPQSPAEPARIAAGSTAERLGPALEVKALVTRCADSAKVAAQRATEVLAPTDPSLSLGTRAANHVRARRVARAACVIASAATGTLETGRIRDDLAAAVAGSESLWRAVPKTTVPPQKGESR